MERTIVEYGNMKTTIDISESLLKEAKQVARAEGITMKELFEQGLRRAFADRTKPEKPFKLRDASIFGERPNRELSWPEMQQILYEGQGK